MTENIEKLLSGICPSCLEESTFNYIGEQKMLDEGPDYLYNCSSCRSTISLETFREQNKITTSSQ